MRGLDTTKTQIERGHDDESARDRAQTKTATEEEIYKEIPIPEDASEHRSGPNSHPRV